MKESNTIAATAAADSTVTPYADKGKKKQDEKTTQIDDKQDSSVAMVGSATDEYGHTKKARITTTNSSTTTLVPIPVRGEKRATVLGRRHTRRITHFVTANNAELDALMFEEHDNEKGPLLLLPQSNNNVVHGNKMATSMMDESIADEYRNDHDGC